MIRLFVVLLLINILLIFIALVIFRSLYSKYLAKYFYKTMNDTIINLNKEIDANFSLLAERSNEIENLLKEARYQSKKLRVLLDVPRSVKK